MFFDKIDFLAIGLMVAIVLFSGLFHYGDDSVRIYTERVANPTDEKSQYSIFYDLGKFFYKFLYEDSFVILPLISFGLAFYFLLRLFKEFALPRLIVPLIFLFYQSWKFVWLYSRDNLLFCLASVFAFYFFKTVFLKEQHFGKLFGLAVLMTLTKSFGFVFLAVAVLLYFWRNQVVFPVVLGDVFQGLASLWPFNPLFVWNPFFWLSIPVALFLKSKWLAFFVLLSFVCTVGIVNSGYNSSLAIRYTWSLTVFHVFYLGLFVKTLTDTPYFRYYFGKKASVSLAACSEYCK